MWERGKAFIIKAGTVIFVACGVIWFLASFGFADGSFGMVETEASLLAAIGGVIAPLLAPLGFGTWQGAVATVSALVAKENAVGTFGVLFGLAGAAEDDPALLAGMAGMFTAMGGFSFLVFNLFNPPCFAAIGAIKREMNSSKWTWIAIGYQLCAAYAMAFIIYQLGSVVFMGERFGVGAGIAAALVGVVLWLLLRSEKPLRTKASKRPVGARA